MPAEALAQVVNTKQEVNWAALLEEALTVEGSTSGIYNRFAYYSFGNQMLLRLQGVQEPVNTMPRWNKMNRRVLKGSKAKAIMIPLLYKDTNEAGEEVKRLRGFKLKPCLFTVSETEGDELPPPEPRDWSKERAMGKLAITEVPFTLYEANTQGFSYGRNIAVSPVAANPLKTWLHEGSHIEAGHTTVEGIAQYSTHRGIYELEAEGSAYILVNELDAVPYSDLSESRAYIQGWIGNAEVQPASYRRIFKTADSIYRAGLAEPTEAAV